jgi:transcriptional regulator with XRE-family HTH domain
MEPKDALRMAREDREWTINAAAKRAGIGDQQLKNLEEGKTTPAKVKSETLIALLTVFWPDLSLQDLVPGCVFKLEPLSPAAAGYLVATSTNENVKDGMRSIARSQSQS